MELIVPRKDLKKVNKVASKAEFLGIQLNSCIVSRTIDAIDFSKLSANLSFNAELIKDAEDSITAGVDLKVLGTPVTDNEDEEEDNAVINLEFSYAISYSLKNRKGLEPDDLETFCSINAVYNAWPFFREIIISMTKKMEIPSIPLPFLKITPEKPPKTPRSLKKPTKKSASKKSTKV